ncbi:hypothetical protein AABM17_2135 [Neisseria musculi]|uniref:Uncharacterized protein n=4 Tax=Neisseria musculi TaxID=1815583 RepID=A0A7H1MAQ0_9NEIS|nr:hypothetical protein H7A79_2134 [Neisseria musculi]
MMDREPEPAKRRAGRQSRRAAAFWGAAAWKYRRVCVSRPLSKQEGKTGLCRERNCRSVSPPYLTEAKTRRAFYGLSARIASLPDRRAETAAAVSTEQKAFEICSRLNRPNRFSGSWNTFFARSHPPVADGGRALEKAGLLTLLMPGSLCCLPKQRLRDFRALAKKPSARAGGFYHAAGRQPGTWESLCGRLLPFYHYSGRQEPITPLQRYAVDEKFYHAARRRKPIMLWQIFERNSVLSLGRPSEAAMPDTGASVSDGRQSRLCRIPCPVRSKAAPPVNMPASDASPLCRRGRPKEKPPAFYQLLSRAGHRSAGVCRQPNHKPALHDFLPCAPPVAQTERKDCLKPSKGVLPSSGGAVAARGKPPGLICGGYVEAGGQFRP